MSMRYTITVPVRGFVTVHVEANDDAAAIISGIDHAMNTDTGDIESLTFESDVATIVGVA
jgi:hypothetical protein